MSTPVYTGVWTNWSHGAVLGATLTLGARDSGLLTAFIATFVTIVAAQLWKILTFAIHQSRCSPSPQDGLYHQQQIIFRNSNTPGSAAWAFLTQSWYWRGRVERSALRTLLWALLAMAFTASFGLLAIFSAQISKSSGPIRLVDPLNCSNWYWKEMTFRNLQVAGVSKLSKDHLAALTYARTCYDNGDTTMCSKLTVPFIKTFEQHDVECPWPGMCLGGEFSAFQVKTEIIDSHYHLGVNAEPSKRLNLQKIMTCAPLKQEGFKEIVYSNDTRAQGLSGTEDLSLVYNYGPLVRGLGELYSNYTFFFDRDAYYGHGYQIEATIDGSDLGLHDDNEPLLWHPISSLTTRDAELTIIFLMPNNIHYLNPCYDPWFAADVLTSGTGTPAYWPQHAASPMACAQQFQVCNPSSQSPRNCTGFKAGYKLTENAINLDISSDQGDLLVRIMRALDNSSLRGLLATLKQNALRAQDTVMDLEQNFLPSDQWKHEVSNWVNIGLSSIQQAMLEYATGPTFWQPEMQIDPPNSTYEHYMCQNQMINETGNTSSFSVLGLAILFGIGSIIVLVSFFLDTGIGYLQKRYGWSEHARLSWILDDKMQLHKLLLNELELGKWTEQIETFPITRTKERFLSLAAEDLATKPEDHTMMLKPNADDHLIDKNPQGIRHDADVDVTLLHAYQNQDYVERKTTFETLVKRKPVPNNNGLKAFMETSKSTGPAYKP